MQTSTRARPAPLVSLARIFASLHTSPTRARRCRSSHVASGEKWAGADVEPRSDALASLRASSLLRICLVFVSHPLRTPRCRSSLRSGVKMGRRRCRTGGRRSLAALALRLPGFESLHRPRTRPTHGSHTRCSRGGCGRSGPAQMSNRARLAPLVSLARIFRAPYNPDACSSLSLLARCVGVEVGRRRFELRLRPPEGRRIPSYPTGPHRNRRRSFF